MENASVGMIVLTVTAQPATDLPPLCSNFSLITYSTIPSMLRLFSIESNGTILIKEHLDFETQQFHVFYVVAQDGCSQATVVVNITVLNVDDSAPVCLSHVVYLSISESTPPSNTTFGLHCTDPDNFGSTILYTIATGNDTGIFDISGGYLSTLKQLNYELRMQHLLLIHISKTTYPSAVTEVTIVVTVLASNEFSPVFSSGIELSYNVNESLPIGSSIANISAQDNDNGYDGIVTYSLSMAQDCFTIDPVSGNLALLCNLDREIQDVYYITILAKDNPTNYSFQRSSNITIELNVSDVNDNAPRFMNNLYTLSVSETITTNVVLLTLHCIDADDGANADVTYYIVDGNSLNHFSVDPISGNLSINRNLNYETHQFYHLKVQCFDNGAQQLSSNASVVIQVLNVNEYDPVISVDYNRLYRIAEDAQVGAVIATVSATDMDTGPAGEIEFSIDRTNNTAALHCPEDLFQIDSISGTLYLLSTLDKESELPFVPPMDYTYECPVVVSNQQPDRQATNVLRISVENVNDEAPVCNQELNVVEISEDFPVGDDVCSFACQDGDSSILTYGIVDPSITFTINQNSTHGIIQLSVQLDYETQVWYSFEVVVSDIGTPPLSTSVVIHVNVKNVNEHAPVFSTGNDSISIPEDTSVGTALYMFSASDNDGDTNLRYTIIEGHDHNLVVLNEVTGVLYLAASLDRELMNHFHLTVQAGDADPVNPLTGITYLNITISDTNDNVPMFSTITHFVSLVETTMIGSQFNLSVCMDNDDGVNSLLSCQILMACSYVHYGGSCVPVTSFPFSFNFSVGEGVVTSLLDYEVAMLYMFEVLCTDQGTPELSASAIVYIEVVPVNEFTPSFDSPSYNVTIAEDVAVGSSFLRVTASDLDSGLDGELFYSLTSNLDYFTVDPNTGVLFVTQPLDREKEISYTLELIASDKSPNINHSSQVYVHVTVGDVNDNFPCCEQSTIIVRISESTPIRSSVIQLNCSDADQLNVLYYAFLSGNEEGLFSVYDNGTIVLSSVLYLQEYRLIISVTDSSPDPLSVLVNCFVYVNRVNQPPTFNSLQPFNISLPLSTVPGSLLFTVNASDGDDVVYYSMLPSTSFLEIDRWSGRIFLVSSLLRSHIGHHMFVLRASDMELTSALNFTVKVTDDMSYSLVFNQLLYFVSVPEDTAINTVLLTVHCTNNHGEVIDNLQYYFPEPNPLFHISQSTGLLSVSGALDFELEDHHNILVVCTDSTSQSVHSATTTVMIAVLPVNEYTPSLVSATMEINVTEDYPVGRCILQVNVTDQDRDTKLRYHLDEDFDLFYLDAFSGVLYLIQSLDYESQVSYNLSVTITDEAPDMHLSVGSIIVHVIDTNDHSPFCDPSFITKVISDDAEVGQSVAMLNCIDHDTGINSQLEFSVTHSNSDLFTIDQSTGEIFVAHELIASTLSSFLIISVSDKGTPALTFTVAVELSIQEFLQPPNDNSLEPPSNANDEGKNNSLIITFDHLTHELVSYANVCI